MKKIFISIIFILLCCGIVISQSLFDSQSEKKDFTEPLVLKPEIIKAADLGLDNAASDLMWLAAIQYFGGGQSKTYEKLDDYLFLASDLDPKFAYPYAFGTLILPGIGQTDKGIELGLKGIEQNIQDYRIPYYVATTFYLDKDEPDKAAFYFDMAANTKDAPEGISKVAANFGSSKDKREQTRAIWMGIYESTKDELVQERAKKYIIHLDMMTLLEEAAEKFKKNNGEYPDNLNQLVSSNILKKIPQDPLGFKFKISEDGKVGVE